MNVCKVKCGDKEISIKIQRPSFKSVEKGYREISKFDINTYNARKKLLYEKLYEWAKSQGKNDKEAHEFAEIESLWIVSIEFAEPRYKQVGGKVEALFNNDKRTYVNTCALRVSYALNYSTHPINTMDRQVIGRGYQGDDRHTYYLGVFDIIEFFKLNWKELTWKKPTYTQVKEKIKCGCSEDFYHNMTSKDENQQFFKELQSIQRKGIVAMRLQGNRVRHTTLWNGNNFVDVEMNKEVDIPLYLFGYDYLNDLNNSYPFVSEFYFWELKD